MDDTLTTSDALHAALVALHRQEPTPKNKAAIATIEMIRAQRGCEHFDSAVDDGRLTSLIDIVVFG